MAGFGHGVNPLGAPPQAKRASVRASTDARPGEGWGGARHPAPRATPIPSSAMNRSPALAAREVVRVHQAVIVVVMRARRHRALGHAAALAAREIVRVHQAVIVVVGMVHRGSPVLRFG